MKLCEKGKSLKKIGVLLDSFNVNKYLYETVHRLAQAGQVELFFLVNSDQASRPGIWGRTRLTIKTQGLLRFIELSFFKSLTAAEHMILSPFSAKIRAHNKSFSLRKFNVKEIVRLHPIFSASRLTVRYPRPDTDKIKSFDLDLIIRGNAPGIFKGDMLQAAKDGIISFHHGDNRWNRGGPAGFWEVYLKKPSTGFIIQILTGDLDGGRVLFRGNIPTLQSYTENIVNLYNESNPYLARLILNYAERGRLPAAEERFPFGGGVLRVPSFSQSVIYLLHTCWVYFSFIVREFILHWGPRWNVAFIKTPWHHAVLRQGIEIKNPPGRYFADPFVITKNGRTVCFVEDCPCRDKKARITAIEIIDGERYNILGPVIEEPFHMSFPFLFEYGHQLYMVPETSQAKAIRLYQCMEFPMKWEYRKDIKTNVNAGDSLVFEYEGKWWLLSNMGTEGNVDLCSTLMAFSSENPLSDDWSAHALNPLVFDSWLARNGGLLDVGSRCPVRVRQRHDFNVYGANLTFAKITDLTPVSFQEEEIGRISPDFFRGINRVHHMHSDGNYTVYDYARDAILI